MSAALVGLSELQVASRHQDVAGPQATYGSWISGGEDTPHIDYPPADEDTPPIDDDEEFSEPEVARSRHPDAERGPQAMYGPQIGGGGKTPADEGIPPFDGEEDFNMSTVENLLYQNSPDLSTATTIFDLSNLDSTLNLIGGDEDGLSTGGEPPQRTLDKIWMKSFSCMRFQGRWYAGS